ncbi:MAG: hypothetical protein HUU02_09050 [Bacteroidetes bacterium]|nr:hypothetical protein [Bacteroidota bacterium]
MVCRSSIALLLAAFAVTAHAGGPSMTGNFRRDVVQDLSQQTVTATSVVLVEPRERQDPFMNGLLSLAVPGIGQFRTENYTRAAVYFGAELALVVYAVISEQNGDEKTAEFQKYAEAHWSAERYARWINTYGSSDYGPVRTIDLNRVRNNDFSQINEWESAPASGKFGFSHTLPPFGDQQYYELIGKYYQFKFGWDTYPVDANGVPVSDGRDYFNNYTADAQIKAYAAERGKANDYYYAASFALSALVVNHAISAIDAFLATKNYNSTITADLNIAPVRSPEGERLYSQLTLSVGF